MKTVTMMLIEETGAKVIKQNPAMEEMAARIGAVGRMDIIPMRPNFDQIYLAFDMAKNPDGPMYDGWEGERKLIVGKGILFRMAGMRIWDLSLEDGEKAAELVEVRENSWHGTSCDGHKKIPVAGTTGKGHREMPKIHL